MQSTSAPSKLSLAFATSGSKNVIPTESTGTPGAASWDGGFPNETMLPVNAGGVPPSGKDFNGVLNEISALIVWLNAGGSFAYDAAFSTAIGGYPKGAKVLKAGGAGYWLSTVENNTTDPNTGGAGWVGNATTVYASAQQTLATGSAKVLFDTVESDGSLWDAANKRFSASIAGPYRISGAVMLSAPGGQLLATQIYKNGVLARQCFQAPQVSDGNLSLPFDSIINCAAGDYLEVFVNAPQSAVLAGVVGSNEAYVFAHAEYLGA